MKVLDFTKETDELENKLKNSDSKLSPTSSCTCRISSMTISRRPFMVTRNW